MQQIQRIVVQLNLFIRHPLGSNRRLLAWFLHTYYMKVAVTLFRNGVSPRIDIADSLLIYDIDNRVVKRKKKCTLTFEHAAQLSSILQKNEITMIICGGCPQLFLRTLCFYGIEVVPGVMGDPDHIVKQLVDGELSDIPSNGLMGRSRGHRRRYGCGSVPLDSLEKE